MNPTGHVVYLSLKGSANHYCAAALWGFFNPSIEELLPAYAQVFYCTLCAIMWSVPVCMCSTDAANVYRAGVSCGFRAGGRSLSLDLRVDADTTKPTWDHSSLTRRQSVVPCNVLSHGTDSQPPHTTFKGKTLVTVNYFTVTVTLFRFTWYKVLLLTI